MADNNNHHFLLGALSSFAATSLTHPLDVIRINQINLQTNFVNTIVAMTKTNRNYFKTFYRGYLLNTTAYTGTYGLFFPLHE